MMACDLLQEKLGLTATTIQQLFYETDNIEYKSNIRVINFDQYLAFLNLIPNAMNWSVFSKSDEEIYSKLISSKDLAIKAFRSEQMFEKLVEIGKKYAKLLKEI